MVIGDIMSIQMQDKGKKVVMTIELDKDCFKSQLELERYSIDKFNEARSQYLALTLEDFDADGGPIVIGGTKYTCKGKSKGVYKTTAGEVEILRTTYQTSAGGKTYVPLEANARIINNATLLCAEMTSKKYSNMTGREVKEDLKMHGIHMSLDYIQQLCESVAKLAEEKHERWSYAPSQEVIEQTDKISISVDGTMLNMKGDGYREVMVGTISRYNKDGELLQTEYVANSPQYGKENFQEKMTRAIEVVKKHNPSAKFIAIADGAKSNWTFLSKFTENKTLDFFHVSEYVHNAAGLMFGINKESEKELWLENRLHHLKHSKNGLKMTMEDINEELKKLKNATNKKIELQKIVGYLENNRSLINYHERISNNEPIGSGIVEAACKSIVKTRMGQGCWVEAGANTVLTLRSLNKSHYAAQFWRKVDKYGVGTAAA